MSTQLTIEWIAELEQSYIERFPAIVTKTEDGFLQVKGNLRVRLLRIEPEKVLLELSVVQPVTKIVMARDEFELTPGARIDFERMEIDLKVATSARQQEG